MRYYRRLFLGIVLALLAVGCKGDMGPVGPSGAEGPQGPRGTQGVAGPAGQDFQYFIGSGHVASNGTSIINLPVGAGSLGQQPLVTCYHGHDGAYLIIGTDVGYGGVSCGMVWSDGRWKVTLIGGVPGWVFRVVAVW
jgi:hypothetical protein